MGKTLSRTNLHANRLSLAFATPGEPGAHRFRQAFCLHVGANFEKTIGKRKCVIKFGLAREIAHAKIIQPIEGAGAAFGADKDFDAHLVSEHQASITRGADQGRQCSKFLAAAESAN